MKLKVGVIGAGNMGRNHVRIYSELENVELVGIADPSEASLRRVGKLSDARTYTDYRQMLDVEKPNAVSVVVPTVLHREVAAAAIERGISVLIEKPLATTAAEGQQIVDLAAKHKVTLMVGHVERFNPAVRELRRRLQENQLGRIFQIHARRLSPFPARILDVGVILDLATHDIDVMRHLLGSDATRVYAEVERKAHQSCEDLLSGLIRFESGAIGVLDINWLTPTKVRQVAVLGEGGMLLADYIAQDVYFYRNSHDDSPWDTLGIFRGVSEGDMIRPHISKREPLRVELESFIQCIVENKTPSVTGQDGLAALLVAERLIQASRSHKPVLF